MMTYLIIVPFLLKPLLRLGLSRFSTMLSPYRKFLLLMYNAERSL